MLTLEIIFSILFVFYSQFLVLHMPPWLCVCVCVCVCVCECLSMCVCSSTDTETENHSFFFVKVQIGVSSEILMFYESKIIIQFIIPYMYGSP